MKTLPKLMMLLALMLVSCLSASAQNADTLYYDQNWKGVESKSMASFFRVLDNSKKHCRDYYISGELQGESNYLTIDKNDDSKSVFDGEICTFYKSGQLKSKANRSNGEYDGEYVSYYDNGKIKEHFFFMNGIPDGETFSYNKDGIIEMKIITKRGKQEQEFYTYYNNGRIYQHGYTVDGKTLVGKGEYFNELGDTCFQAQFVDGKAINWHAFPIEEYDFLQQTKGWEWVYIDDSEDKSSTYPYSASWKSYRTHPQYKIIFAYVNNRGSYTTSESGQAFIFNEDGTLMRVNSLNEHLYSSDWKYNLDEKKNETASNEQNRQEQAQNAVRQVDYNDLCRALLSNDMPDKYRATVETTSGHFEVVTLREYIDNYAFKNVPERQDTTMLFLVAKKKGKSFGSILADVAVASIIGDDGRSSDSPSWSVDLKDNDIIALQEWMEKVNRNSGSLKFELASEKSSGSKSYCAVICYNMRPKVKQNDFTDAQTLDVSCIIGSYSTSPIIDMAKDSVLCYVMRKDYKNNKYGILNEPLSVRNIVEEKLGLKAHTPTASELKVQQIVMKQMCKRYGISYVPNMTEKQFKAAMTKKYKNNPRALAEKLADMMQNINGVYQEAMGEAFYSGALLNSKESKRAELIISQLKQDHSNDIKRVSITRADNLTFVVDFSGCTNHKVEIKYAPTKSFSAIYEIKIIN